MTQEELIWAIDESAKRIAKLEAENAKLREVLKLLDFADKFSSADNWEHVWKAFDDVLPGFRFRARTNP